MRLVTLVAMNMILQLAMVPTLQLKTTKQIYVELVMVLHILMFAVLQAAVMVVIRQEVVRVVIRMHLCETAVTQGYVEDNELNELLEICCSTGYSNVVSTSGQRVAVMMQGVRWFSMRINAWKTTMIQSV